MNILLISLLGSFGLLLPSNLSLATVIPSPTPSYHPLTMRPTYQVKVVGKLRQINLEYRQTESALAIPVNLAQTSIQIVEGKIVLGENLQAELSEKIVKARTELAVLSKKLSINFNHNIGIVYLHQGQDNWRVNFTFGGVILNTSEQIIFSTKQVFLLKECFEQTKWIEIQGQKYPTTASMRQIGPILHSEE